MSETASFVYSNSAMESLRTDLTKIQTAAQASLDDLQGQKAVAEATLAEATSTYNKEKAVYEAAMVKYKQALEAYTEALESFKKAMSEFSKYTPPSPIPDGYVPPTPPTPPTPPVEPTPPSPDAMNAAKAALAAVNESIMQVTNDIECLNTLVDTIKNISNQVMSTDQEAVHVLTNDFFKLYEFSGMQSTGNDVANAIVRNSKAVQDGYDYIVTDTGNGSGRLYLDLFADEKLNMPQFINLGKTIGTNALIAVMQQQGWGVEAIYHAAHTVDSSVEFNNVKSTFNDFANGNRQSPIHSDQSNKTQINNAMGVMNEDVTVFVDGRVQGTAALSALGVNTNYDYGFMPCGSNYGATLVTDAHTYTVVPDGDPRAKQDGYMTESDYDRILYIVAHEVGTCNANEKFGVASALMNQLEQKWGAGDTIKDGLDCYYKNNAAGGANDRDSIYFKADELSQYKDDVKAYVDMALNGQRAFTEEIQSWTSDEASGYTRCLFGTPIDVGGIATTSGKSGYR